MSRSLRIAATVSMMWNLALSTTAGGKSTSALARKYSTKAGMIDGWLGSEARAESSNPK